MGSLMQSEISAWKIQAYQKTDYRFGEGTGAITLRVDVHSDELARLFAKSAQTCGLFITAFNPFGQVRSVDANEAAHVRLRTELKSVCPLVIEGAGADPTGAWPPEKSYFALGVDLEASKHLGQQYGQDAIVWAGKDAIPRLILLR
jgi:hypothetical protein